MIFWDQYQKYQIEVASCLNMCANRVSANRHFSAFLLPLLFTAKVKRRATPDGGASSNALPSVGKGEAAKQQKVGKSNCFKGEPVLEGATEVVTYSSSIVVNKKIRGISKGKVEKFTKTKIIFGQLFFFKLTFTLSYRTGQP